MDLPRDAKHKLLQDLTGYATDDLWCEYDWLRLDHYDALNTLSVQRLVGESTTGTLWTRAGHPKALSMSLLPFPTFKDEIGYYDSPRVSSSGAFRSMLSMAAKRMNALLADTLLLPLGAQVAHALVALRRRKRLQRELLAIGRRPICLPRPSGASAESIGLVIHGRHASTKEYAEERHAQYLQDKPWMKDGKPGPRVPGNYKATRKLRWEAVSRLRRHSGFR